MALPKTKIVKFSYEEWKNPSSTKLSAEIAKFKEEIKADPLNYGPSVVVTSRSLTKTTTSTLANSPITGFSNKDAFVILTKEPQYYLRFGALLNYIKDNIILKIKNPSKEGIFNINTDFNTQKMYSLPNRISLDPRICIVRNSSIDIGSFSADPTSLFSSSSLYWETKTVFNTEDKTAKAFDILEPFTNIDNGGSNVNSAYSLNIYLNFNFILESLSPDDKGNISVYDLLSKICTGLNRALGGINNLEPIIDESSNTLQIIDTTPIPKTQKSPGYTLQIYGYDKGVNNYISNFVRKVDLKTAITPEYATMITVGATAGGYVKGVEATAFSKWNTGLTDRFKEEFLPPNGTKESPKPNEASFNYIDTFLLPLKPLKISNRFGLTSFGENKKFSDNIIEKNISVVTEYYKWLIAKNTEGKDKSGGTVGFIPFKLGLTLDGISGIKIYNVLRVNTEFLPKAYGKTVDLIVTGVSHRLNNNDWETSIEATVMPKTGEMALVAITAEILAASINNATTKKKGADIIPKDPNKLCGLANAKNVNTVYPKSVKWQGGKAPVIVTPTKSPSVTINLKNVPKVARISTTYTSKQVIEGAKIALNRMAPSASDKYKKLIITSALTVAIKEQSLKGFNNNLTGVEASGFKLFTKDEVVGKVILPEGQGTGKIKEYYAFKDLSSGLVPVISKILERNMFATGGTANEFAWRYFRDWNGYGGRTTEHYALPSNQKSKAGVSGYDSDDCKIISGIESAYDKAAAYVKQYY